MEIYTVMSIDAAAAIDPLRQQRLANCKYSKCPSVDKKDTMRMTIQTHLVKASTGSKYTSTIIQSHDGNLHSNSLLFSITV